MTADHKHQRDRNIWQQLERSVKGETEKEMELAWRGGSIPIDKSCWKSRADEKHDWPGLLARHMMMMMCKTNLSILTILLKSFWEVSDPVFTDVQFHNLSQRFDAVW